MHGLMTVLWSTLQASALIAGVWLGDPPASVRARLGDPARREVSLGLEFWDYDRKGLSLIWDLDRTALRVIVLKTADAGPVEGVRVGDDGKRLRARWGEPARTRQEGRFMDFTRAGWVQTAELRAGRVVEITLTAR